MDSRGVRSRPDLVPTNRTGRVKTRGQMREVEREGEADGNTQSEGQSQEQHRRRSQGQSQGQSRDQICAGDESKKRKWPTTNGQRRFRQISAKNRRIFGALPACSGGAGDGRPSRASCSDRSPCPRTHPHAWATRPGIKGAASQQESSSASGDPEMKVLARAYL